MVTVGPKPHGEVELAPAPSPGRVGDDAQQQPAGVQPGHPSGPLAGVRRGFGVSRTVASRRSVSTASGGGQRAPGSARVVPRSTARSSTICRSWSRPSLAGVADLGGGAARPARQVLELTIGQSRRQLQEGDPVLEVARVALEGGGRVLRKG
jgi:hypothetical protein